MNMYIKFHQNISKVSKYRARLNFLHFGPRQSLVERQKHLAISIAMCIQNVIKTFARIFTLAKPRPLRNDIWQSRELDLVNINVNAKCH